MPTTGQPQASSRASDHTTKHACQDRPGLQLKAGHKHMRQNTVQATGPPQDAPVPATGQHYSSSTPSATTHKATAATACRMQLQAGKSRNPRLLAVLLSVSAPTAAQQHTRPAKPFRPWYNHHRGLKDLLHTYMAWHWLLMPSQTSYKAWQQA